MEAESERILFIDPDKCTGCRICEMACSFGKIKECNPSRSRIHVVKIERLGVDMPIVCQHCEVAPCIKVCPVGAIAKDPKTAAVLIAERACIGCRACMIICPYGAITIDPENRTAVKCDLCEGDPRCAKQCPTGAIRYVTTNLGSRLRMKSVLERFVESTLKK